MKTRSILILSVFLSVILLFAVGCQKNPPIPAPTPVAPVITLSGVATSTLPYADSTSFSWTVQGKDLYVSLEGKEVSSSGTYSTHRLFIDKTYKLSATNDGGTVSSTINLKVGAWTSSMYGMISHKYWVFGSLSQKSYLTGNTWYVYTKKETGPLFYTFSYYYFPSGILETRNRYNNHLISSDHWDLEGDTLLIKGGQSGIVTRVTVDTMITVYTSSFADSTGKKHIGYVRTIYIRDNY